MNSDALFPVPDVFNKGRLIVSDVHTLYFEESGNPNGQPVIILHGGPGGGSQPEYGCSFDPAHWRIIQFDQRGCGKSTPYACLENNTTWDSVADIETLREHLGLEQWLVFGGSWGATLSLAYGQTHPERCLGFILRGVFMLRPTELNWYYQNGAEEGDQRAGAHTFFPEEWQDYLAPIPASERADMMGAYYRRLTSDDAQIRKTAARAWSLWEGRTSKLIPDTEYAEAYGDDEFAEAFARIECHYFTNGGFFDVPDQLLKNIGKIAHLPAVIVQGRYDMVCPLISAWELAQQWPAADLKIIDHAGHSWSEPDIQAALVAAGQTFVARGVDGTASAA